MSHELRLLMVLQVVNSALVSCAEIVYDPTHELQKGQKLSHNVTMERLHPPATVHKRSVGLSVKEV